MKIMIEEKNTNITIPFKIVLQNVNYKGTTLQKNERSMS